MALTADATMGAGHTVSSQVTGALTSVTGDLGIVFARSTQAQPFSSQVDSKTNTPWTQFTGSPYAVGVADYLYAFWVALASVGASHTATFAVSGGGTDLVDAFLAMSGRNLTSPLDGTLGTFTDSGFNQSHTGPSITTSQAGSDLLSFYFENGATTADTWTAGASWTKCTNAVFLGNGTIQSPAMVQYRLNVAAGTYSAPCTTGNFVKPTAILIALAPAASGQPAMRRHWRDKRPTEIGREGGNVFRRPSGLLVPQYAAGY